MSCYDVYFSEWFFKVLINLFDGIELIVVILNINDCSYGIFRYFKNMFIVFSCISLLWSVVDVNVIL